MCHTPIIIANRSRRYTDCVSSRFFAVPCGHCHECQKRVQDDWFVRSFFEYQRVRSIGSTWFFTLTYTDDNLPVYIDNDYCDNITGEVKPFRRPCFSNKDIKRFRDRLRTYLRRAGYPIKDIRFFISCELGENFGRPHYHPLLFLPFHIPFKVLFELLEKAWPYGRVGFSKKHGMLVTSDKAVEYCCKYISKDSAWFRYFGLSDYLNYLYTQFRNGVEGAHEKLLLFRRSYRLHFQSMRFGSTGVDHITKDDLVNNRIDLVKLGLNVDSNCSRGLYAIPDYLKRKLLKYTDAFGLSCPTALQDEVNTSRYDDLISAFSRRYSLYFDYASFKEHLQPLSLSEDALKRSYDDLHSLSDYVSVENLSVYSLVYHSRLLYTTDNYSWPNPILGVSPIRLRYTMSPKACLSLLVSKAKDFFVHSHDYELDIPTPKGQSRFDLDKRHFFSRELPSYSDLPCFHGFDSIIDTIASYEHQLGTVLSRSATLDDDRKFHFALLTNIFNDKYSFIYSKIYEL